MSSLWNRRALAQRWHGLLTNRASVRTHRLYLDPPVEVPRGAARHSSQTSAGLSRTKSRVPKSYLAAALSSILGASLGYYAATSNTAKSPGVSTSGLNDNYGTPEDFQKAIEELRTTFPKEGTVTTDSEDLQIHGHSENDYHPGELLRTVITSPHLLKIIPQGPARQSSSTRILQMMS